MSFVDDSVFELFVLDLVVMEEGKIFLNSWLEEKVLYKRYGYLINLELCLRYNVVSISIILYRYRFIEFNLIEFICIYI